MKPTTATSPGAARPPSPPEGDDGLAETRRRWAEAAMEFNRRWVALAGEDADGRSARLQAGVDRALDGVDAALRDL